MQNNMKNGFKMMAPAFVTIGEETEGFWLTDVIPSGADKMTVDENTIELQTLSVSGIAVHNYMYHKGDSMRSYPQGDGWYEDTDFISKEEGTDVWFKAGEGFWVSGNTELKFTTAGQVKMSSITIPLENGFRIVANPYPASVFLSTIVPAGADKMTVDENTIELQTLNESGIAVHNYMYHKGDSMRSYPQGDGWYEDTDFISPEEGTDVEIKAGESVWVAGNKPLTLTFVTPFEDAE